jgi:hypothetical protein
MPGEWVPTRWWRVVRDVPVVGRHDIWCESSDEGECRAAVITCRWKAVRLEHLFMREETEWRQA